MAETKYGKYIITEPKRHVKLPEYRRDSEETLAGISTPVAYLDDEVIKGGFYVECVWFTKGSDEPIVTAHTHDFDEVITFFGTNPEDVRDLGGEVEIWLGDEKHTLTNSCIVFVPKGLKHSPLVIKRVDRPIFHFTAGPARTYQ